MNDNTNKTKVVAAIWENPARVFGCEFRQSGKYLENLRGGDYDERGKIRLLSVGDGANITVFYNGASRPEKCDVFTYLGDYVLNTSGFRETLERCAEIYNIPLQYTTEERDALSRQALAREVAPTLTEALRLNPTGAAGRYLTEARALNIDGHFGELTEQSIQLAVDALEARGKAYNAADFKALGLTAERARQGYNLVIPYVRNGSVVGFLFRDVTGKAKAKYMFSQGLSRGGYCERLTVGEPAVVVEGEIDAIRLTQAGVGNVVGLGNAQMTEGVATLLKGRGVEQITYIPDYECDEQGNQRTDIVHRAVEAFLTAKVDGEPVVKNLYVANLNPDGTTAPDLKIDADSYGREHGGQALADVVANAGAWWAWECEHLLRWAASQDDVNVSAFQSKFDAIYNRCANVYERERIKQYIDDTGRREIFEPFGVTPQALNERDEWNRNREYNNRVKAYTTELADAVAKGANPATVGEIVTKLADTQTTNTRDEWDKQVKMPFDDVLAAIRNQPDTLTTKWTLGNINKDGRFVKYETIEFWAADITVFCAPTSHGKTMILFQSALDLVKANPTKTFLFVSCEENNRQLTERALNVYLDIETTQNGKAVDGSPCFVTGTRKRTIKAVLRGDVPPSDFDDMFVAGEYNTLADKIKRGVEDYGRNVRPRLIFVHTDGTAESIAANILHTVAELRASGVEVGGVFVDYMQLLTSENKSFSRHDELKDVCKALKRTATTLEVPVIIAAQLNREVVRNGIDTVTVANIGEGADIERIAHDIYFVWQVDKTKQDLYFKYDTPRDGVEPQRKWNYTQAGDRANRIFSKGSETYPNNRELKRGYIYVEQMKARDGKTDGWGLFPFDGERGYIGANDTSKMAE